MSSRRWRQNHPNARSFVRFVLDGAHYALPVQVVRLVVRAMSLVSVPGGEEGVLLGLVRIKEVQGMVVPVFDLRGLYGMSLGPSTHWLLVQVGDRVVGAAVDEVLGVMDVLPERLQPAPAPRSRLEAPVISMVADVGDNLVFLLDKQAFLARLEELLSDPSIASMAPQAAVVSEQDQRGEGQ